MRTSKRFWLLPALILLATLALAAAPAQYAVDSGASLVAFEITKFGVGREQGRFHSFRGEVHYDAVEPEASWVEFTVRSATIDTGIGGRDRVLRSEDFFDVSRYPALTFRSTRVVPRDDGSLEVTGELTIRGVTRELTVPVRLLPLDPADEDGTALGFETRFQLDRTDFGVNGTRWSRGRLLLGHEVDIHLRILARRS